MSKSLDLCKATAQNCRMCYSRRHSPFGTWGGFMRVLGGTSLTILHGTAMAVLPMQNVSIAGKISCRIAREIGFKEVSQNAPVECVLP